MVFGHSNVNSERNKALKDKECRKTLETEQLIPVDYSKKIALMDNLNQEAINVTLTKVNVRKGMEPQKPAIHTPTPITNQSNSHDDLHRQGEGSEVSPMLLYQIPASYAGCVLENMAITKNLLVILMTDELFKVWIEIRSPAVCFRFSDSAIFPTLHYSRILVDCNLTYYLEIFGQRTKTGSLVLLDSDYKPFLNLVVANSILEEISVPKK
uniref:Uncharacterized protein n=1 Tax=Daphnia galeata TaxID=27404 RepID=A0A8J2WES3_9CRUS|nr:unnamed protein product [Daphnia galeata]